MKGRVTLKHIKNGYPEDNQYCPIALSLQDKFGEDTDIKVSSTEVYIVDQWYKIRRGTRFIKRFDAGLPVKPMTYELSPI